MALRNITVNWSYDTSIPANSFRVVIKDAEGVVLNQGNALASTARTYLASNVNVGDTSTTLDVVVSATNNDGTTNSDVFQRAVTIAPPNTPVVTSVNVTQ